MASHSPGDWQIEDHGELGGDIRDHRGDLVAHVYCHNARPEQAIANAHLIKAAPDLLETLEMVATLDRPLTAGEKRRVANAIAFAKGSQ